jgi:hypothetical protein
LQRVFSLIILLLKKPFTWWLIFFTFLETHEKCNLELKKKSKQTSKRLRIRISFPGIAQLKLWVRIPFRRGVLDTTLCDKVCQWLAVGTGYFPGIPVSSANKTDRHNLCPIQLLKYLAIKYVYSKSNLGVVFVGCYMSVKRKVNYTNRYVLMDPTSLTMTSYINFIYNGLLH